MEGKTLIRLVQITLAFLAMIGNIILASALIAGATGWIFIGVIILGIPAYFFFVGLKVVQKPEIWIIEVLGKYYETIEAGLHWLCPHLTFVRAIIPGWILPIELFIKKPSIDFKGGGTAVLDEPTLWGRVIDVRKAIYEVSNWKTATRELAESQFKSYLGTLTVDEAITKIHDSKSSWWKVLKELYPTLDGDFRKWGFAGDKITVTDFDWGPEVVAQRQRVYEAARKIAIAIDTAEAAKHDAKRDALKIGGVIGQIKKIMVDELGYTKKRAEELAPKLFSVVKLADTGSLFLTSLEGTGLGPLVSQIKAILKQTEKRVEERTKEKTD